VLELPFGKALAMVGTGEIADAKTMLLLQWAALSGPFSAACRTQNPGTEGAFRTESP
jgi:hypothetical protein